MEKNKNNRPVGKNFIKVFNVIRILIVSAFRIFNNYYLLIKNSNKVNTIFFFPQYHTGGAEKVHLQIVKCLDGKKSMVFFSNKSKDDAYYYEFRENAILSKVPQIIYLHSIFEKIYILTIVFLIQKNKNIRNIFGCNNSLFYKIISELDTSKIKVIDLLHAFSDKGKGIENFSINYVDKIDYRVVINQKTKNDYIRQYNKNGISLNYTDRIIIIPNGISMDHILNDEKPINDKLNILYAGRTTYEKRPNLYIEIAKKLNHKCNFYLAGSLSENIDLSDVKYLGNLGSTELQETYKKADILLLTSSREGFPMVIMESMAHGVVPIATNVGSINEHIKNNFNGFLINETEESNIIEQMIAHITFLDKNRINLSKMSKNAKNYAKENFDLENFTKKYKNLFDK